MQFIKSIPFCRCWKSRYICTVVPSDFFPLLRKVTTSIVAVFFMIGLVITVTHKSQKKKYAYQGTGLIRNIKDDSGNTIQWKPLVLHSSKMTNVFHAHHKIKDFLKRRIHNLTLATEPADKAENVCKGYYEDVFIDKYVMPNFYGQCKDHHSRTKISLLLQMETSEAYFRKLWRISKNWKSPISVVFYFQNTVDNINYRIKDFRTRVEEIFHQYYLQGSSICVHVVFTKESPSYFPINTLRNIATRFAHTDLVLMSEVDFIPQPNLDVIINKYFKKPDLQHSVFVIPAFGTLMESIVMPKTKKELLAQWNNNHTVPIHELKDTSSGHIHTDYAAFRTATKPYQVTYHLHYEPYYVVNRRNVPPYPELLSFGFRDKCIHAFLLNTMGFNFHVLPEGFMVHTPHTKVYHRDYRTVRCADQIYKDLIEEVQKRSDSGL